MDPQHKARRLGLTPYQLSKLDGAKQLVRDMGGEIDDDVVTVQAIKIARTLSKTDPKQSIR
jgi:hypothetical protein